MGGDPSATELATVGLAYVSNLTPATKDYWQGHQARSLRPGTEAGRSLLFREQQERFGGFKTAENSRDEAR